MLNLILIFLFADHLAESPIVAHKNCEPLFIRKYVKLSNPFTLAS